jgi:ubiquinone/menaquinone biosynthesis C-methylase UbiE
MKSQDVWDKSYKNKDNFIFYPHEEIVRFISKYIKKRVALDEFIYQSNCEYTPKVLDVGCGIGRHVRLINEFGLNAFGFDLSTESIRVAKEHFLKQNLKELVHNVVIADIAKLPYEDAEFDFMLSHGVIDSMPFNIAKKGMSELYRVAKSGAKIYIDLVASTDSSFKGEHEKIVNDTHENGTVQSYFNQERIDELIGKKFKILEQYIVNKEDCLKDSNIRRYHIIIEKIG